MIFKALTASLMLAAVVVSAGPTIVPGQRSTPTARIAAINGNFAVTVAGDFYEDVSGQWTYAGNVFGGPSASSPIIGIGSIASDPGVVVLQNGDWYQRATATRPYTFVHSGNLFSGYTNLCSSNSTIVAWGDFAGRATFVTECGDLFRFAGGGFVGNVFGSVAVTATSLSTVKDRYRR